MEMAKLRSVLAAMTFSRNFHQGVAWARLARIRELEASLAQIKAERDDWKAQALKALGVPE